MLTFLRKASALPSERTEVMRQEAQTRVFCTLPLARILSRTYSWDRCPTPHRRYQATHQGCLGRPELHSPWAAVGRDPAYLPLVITSFRLKNELALTVHTLITRVMNPAHARPMHNSLDHHRNAGKGSPLRTADAIFQRMASLTVQTAHPGKTKPVPPIHQARKWYVPEASEECGTVRWRPGGGTDAPAERT